MRPGPLLIPLYEPPTPSVVSVLNTPEDLVPPSPQPVIEFPDDEVHLHHTCTVDFLNFCMVLFAYLGQGYCRNCITDM